MKPTVLLVGAGILILAADLTGVGSDALAANAALLLVLFFAQKDKK